jgi:uncharacterized repeat protein (TIGR03803 family)
MTVDTRHAHPVRPVRIAAAVFAALLAAPFAGAQAHRATPPSTYELVHAFPPDGGAQADGWNVSGALMFTRDGTAYGVTCGGGVHDRGTIYRIASDGSFLTVHSFGRAVADCPSGPLLEASDGFLYGSARAGGAYDKGSLFRFDRHTGQVTLLHSFVTRIDGDEPEGGLVQAGDGNLYGVTLSGSVYRLTLGGELTVIHVINDNRAHEGYWPSEGPLLASDGNLYVTALNGGVGEGGTLLRVALDGTTTVLHAFGTVPGDGNGLYAGVTQGEDGALYGVTEDGGIGKEPGNGVVFRCTLDGQYAVIHQLSASDGGGIHGITRPLPDGHGNVLVSTADSTKPTVGGAILRVAPDGATQPFAVFGIDGQSPRDSGSYLSAGPDGRVYGAARYSSEPGSGSVVYRVTP